MPKTRDASPSSSSSASSDAGVSLATESKKRKRNVPDTDELEIDVNAPEPPSKKALRKAKKAKTKPEGSDEDGAAAAPAAAAGAEGEKKRSDYGIWIGNLPFSADKLAVRLFFTRNAGIPDLDITRMHMPVPQGPPQPGRQKPANKGFAYVDFANAEGVEKAIAVSDTLLSGRKVLIKDAKSFAGRPEKATATIDALVGQAGAPDQAAARTPRDAPGAKPPSKRVFVGNLSFEVTKDELETHFSQAGDIQDVHMATFEDSGKCKGYAWVTFSDLEAAEAAVKGFIWKFDDASDAEESDEEASDQDDEQKPKKTHKQKKRKWFINRLVGRQLRCEFAEDASTRYKKRFGKERPAANTAEAADAAPITEVDGEERQQRKRQRGDKDQRQEQRRQKFDARKIRPGAALANAPRASGAIVEGQGKKISFDD